MNQRSVNRPRRWDMPFSRDGGYDTELLDADVDRLLETDAFRDIDQDGFKASLPLREILKNDVRIVKCKRGDIVVRHGDWGSSAFYILSGAVRVQLDRGDESSDNLIRGRHRQKKKSFFRALAQLWSNNRHAEVRSKAKKSTHADGTRSVDGVTRIYISDVSAVIENQKTARLETGQWFGELAALGRTPRVANVFAEDEATLLEIRWQGLRDILRFDRTGALKNFIERMFRERALASFLRTEPMFADLTDEAMEQLTNHCRLETFGEYDTAKPFRDVTRDDSPDEVVIAEEGDYPDSVYLIRSGVARLSQKYHDGRRTVGYLNPGRPFGLSEVINALQSNDATAYASRLSAIGYLNAVSIPAGVIESLVQNGSINLPQTTSNDRSKDSQDLAAAGTQGAIASPSVSSVDEHLLNFLVDGKYVQGSASMVIDLDRCTRCDDCVQACAVAHDNNPRFIRHGPISGRHMIANACMHCADPVCMIECPTAAIHRDTDDGLVLINELTCIGCAQCASNCPFDAIRMVETRDEDGELIVDSKNTPILEATKCDLCYDQPTGPACQRACPHDALERIDLRVASELGGVIQR